MAGSRLEKVGTIYTRVSGLIQSKALNWQDRPLWYDVYEAFPPNEEPRFDRPAPNIQLKKIFYKEDKIRAMFHRNNKRIGAINLLGHGKTLTQRFIDTYLELESRCGKDATEEQLYTEAIHILNREREDKRKPQSNEIETVSLSSSFKEAKKKREKELNVKVKSLF
ncbi:probable 28S ribosomal protein S23, mitochondrial [Sitophilus oryzae]|uniref:Small ribosomal subunit protein mS23 n=1 Tax=Sitophilus oryzae TaxID=7048 RepID=A0A6J2XUU8_SITOR|nr:probable 28S ribosomal protein S23, mitochondrial [Sitophilus oryzae]